MESWPLFAFRRRFYRNRGIRWHEVPDSAVRDVLGPAPCRGSAHDRAHRRRQARRRVVGLVGVEDRDRVAARHRRRWSCSRRIGWRREYDLAERVVPEDLRSADLSDEECLVALIADAARTLGVGTAADIADVHRLKTADVRRHAVDAGLVPVEVRGLGRDRLGDAALRSTGCGSRSRARHRTTLLSPFDSLVWHRPRTERIFGLEHRLEAYTPAHKRVHGYFAMPVLHQGRLVARVDPKREKDGLHARRVTLESTSQESVRGTARALREAASWVGARTGRRGGRRAGVGRLRAQAPPSPLRTRVPLMAQRVAVITDSTCYLPARLGGGPGHRHRPGAGDRRGPGVRRDRGRPGAARRGRPARLAPGDHVTALADAVPAGLRAWRRRPVPPRSSSPPCPPPCPRRTSRRSWRPRSATCR